MKYLKNEIGHNILLLYQKSKAVVEKRSISFDFPNDINADIYQNILMVLSEFALGDRYSNIDVLVYGQERGDPVASWFERVDKIIFENQVSSKKKKKIADEAEYIDRLMSSFTYLQFISETGSVITSVNEASFRTGLQEAVAPYRQLYVLQIIRYWVEIIFALQYPAMKLNRQDIPFFTDIFGPFYNPNSYLKSRKTWDKF